MKVCMHTCVPEQSTCGRISLGLELKILSHLCGFSCEVTWHKKSISVPEEKARREDEEGYGRLP